MKQHRYVLRLAIAGVGSAVLVGCGPKKDAPITQPVAPAAAQTASLSFSDVAPQAGLNFKHVNGAFGKKWLPETMGSGVAWIDYDKDGYPDLFVVNGRDWTANEKKPANAVDQTASGDATCKLFRNKGDGTFEDVTVATGVGVAMYGMGATVGDFDNDSNTDLYVTGLGRNYLFRNTGGKFEEIATQAGVKDGGWSSCAAWVDYDNDGKLDLVVGHYVKWTPAADIPFPRNSKLTYGTPGQYVGEPLRLYHNEGGGKFKEVTKEAGMLANAEGKPLQGKSLGIALCDYDSDGKMDIAVSNDTEPNYLFHNEGNGKFKEVGVEMGMALPDSGVARGAMGIDVCDYDRKGRESLVIGNFSNQGLALYHNEGGVFRDDAPSAGVLQPTLLSLTFGCFFFDADNDGWLDVFVANGHVDDLIQEVQQQVSYAEQPHLFLNQGNGKFLDIADKAGTALTQKYVSRGAAYADYELRGVPSIAMSTSNGPLHLLKNSGDAKNKSLRLELEGVKSNRSAIGALVEIKYGDAVQKLRVRSGSSYLSQSELPLTIGLGAKDKADSVTVTWTSGEKSELGSLAAGQIYRVVEGKGVASQRAFGQPAPRQTARAN